MEGAKTPSPKMLKPFTGPKRRITVKENSIDSAVSEILQDRRKTLLLYIIGLSLPTFQYDGQTLQACSATTLLKNAYVLQCSLYSMKMRTIIINKDIDYN